MVSMNYETTVHFAQKSDSLDDGHNKKKKTINITHMKNFYALVENYSSHCQTSKFQLCIFTDIESWTFLWRGNMKVSGHIRKNTHDIIILAKTLPKSPKDSSDHDLACIQTS